MSPKRPMEVVIASNAVGEAWVLRDEYIEGGDNVGVVAMNLACDILQEHFNRIYNQWQAIGGTSNIDSIALFDPRTPEQRDLDEWQAEASDVGYGKNGRPR